MASETDCLNDALAQIGAQPVSAIDDGTTNANLCLRFYPPLRDALLRSHHWNFSITRVQLALDVTPPVTGFAYAYTIPPDSLKVIDYAGSLPVIIGIPYGMISNGVRLTPVYRIEGNKLFSNDGQAFIVYIKKVTNLDLWDPLAYQVLCTQLASKLALAIPKDGKKAAELMSTAMNVLLPQALAVDGQEGSIEAYQVDDLTWGR